MSHERCPHCGDKLSHGRPGDPRKAKIPWCQRAASGADRIRSARQRTEARRAAREAERLELERARETVSRTAPRSVASG